MFLRENSVSSVYIGTLAADGTQLLAHRRLTLDENENNPLCLDTRTARQSCLIPIETVLQRYSNRPPISPWRKV